MDKRYKILVLNLGSTSNEIALCENEDILLHAEENIPGEKLKAATTTDEITAQRMEFVEQFIKENNIDLKTIDAIAARGTGKGGHYRHGAYLITDEVGQDVLAKKKAGHAGLYSSSRIAFMLSKEYGKPAYFYDVVPTDEVADIARISGIPGHTREVHSHTLNCRATARAVAESLGKDPYDVTFIVCHIGGGCGTMCYKDGIIIDGYSAEEGSFTPVRPGRIPQDYLIKVYGDETLDAAAKKNKLSKNVGMQGHLGTGDCIEVERRIAAGDKKALLVYQAMAYQLSKDIGAMATVVNGKVDAIILTGGVAHSEMFTGFIKERVGFIAPVIVKPGSMEVEALARGITRVLNGEEEVNDYAQVSIPIDPFANC